MAGRLQQDLLNSDGVLFDVPLPESHPMQDNSGPLSLPARTHATAAHGHSNTTFVDDVGFEDEDLSEDRNFGGPVYNASDYGSVGRAPIPVPTISEGMVPYSGVHLLAGVEAVDIEQTVELEDLLASVESENRYVVRSARGETLFVAAETSSECQRRYVGSSRSLRMRVYDPSRQESLHLSRRVACGAGPCGLLLGCCCYLQHVDVLLPPGRPLGAVVQAWTLLVPVLEVQDVVGNTLYRIEGPGMRPWPCTDRHAVFKITSRDGLVEVGSISHQWRPSKSSHITRVIFPSSELNIHHKALLMSAAFLLEYMFFESSKKKAWFPFGCCS